MTTNTDSLLPLNSWGGTVDPDELAADICKKWKSDGVVDIEMAMSALLHTSKVRGPTRVYYQSSAEELLVKVMGVCADASEVHRLLAEGYTEDVFLVRMALATHPGDMEAARAMLKAPTKKSGGNIDPDQLAADIRKKWKTGGVVDIEMAKSALLHTSKVRGSTRLYYKANAEKLLAKVVGVSADASDVHSLLAEGYTEDVFLVRMALASHPNDIEAARAMLETATKDLGGDVDPDQLAAEICKKWKIGVVDIEMAKSALLHTSNVRDGTRLYYKANAEKLLAKVVGVSADASEVHSLLAEGYTEDVFLVRMALATHPDDIEVARAMLETATKLQ